MMNRHRKRKMKGRMNRKRKKKDRRNRKRKKKGHRNRKRKKDARNSRRKRKKKERATAIGRERRRSAGRQYGRNCSFVYIIKVKDIFIISPFVLGVLAMLGAPSNTL